MTARTVLLFALALWIAGLAILVARVALLLLSAWLDRRRARRAAERDPFPAVHLPADGDKPELICLPGGRDERAPGRRAYPGGRWN